MDVWSGHVKNDHRPIPIYLASIVSLYLPLLNVFAPSHYTMSPSAIVPDPSQTAPPAGWNAAQNGTQVEQSVPNPVYLSTEPKEDFDWKVGLKGKVIAITGANRGIGLGLATVCLANDAAEIYSLDLFEPGEEFQALSAANPKRVRYLHCDVTSEESVTTAVDTIVAQSGRIDGMIANAGMTKHQPALNFDRPQLEQLFNLNVFGAYFCANAAAKKFIELGIKGSIVFTASMTSYRPNRAAPSAPYGGTKAAVRNMAHTLAMEWAKHGIRVNSISPGFVRTQMTYYVEKAPDWNLKMQYYGGMPRLADPRELGGAYVYLLSDSASYTTGIDIPIAGIVGAW
jgi:NAD(P)-dependent dehydrogenase (short-subunit alcohol dehydrogenase family)